MAADEDPVHELRRLWQPVKKQLVDAKEREDIRIRVHRCHSWMQRAEELLTTGDLDLSLALRWVAFNSLYGCWDSERRAPLPDDSTWRQFLASICSHDDERLLMAMLAEHRLLVIAILLDEYVNKYFWESPSDARARSSRAAGHEAKTWYLEARAEMIASRVLERIYLVRCQLLHGAATHGGQLNRLAVERCSTMLGHLLVVFLQVIAKRARDLGWGQLCYPPLDPGTRTARGS
jgi:hypothetical protein